ncbi:UbiA family prenyltransferase [bacterium]|nr:UbiA family prenyltransferase [bacterium]
MSALRVIADDIKIAHSIFALPFAVLAAAMAAFAAGDGRIDWTDFAGQLALVVVAMVFARTAAMLANRILDRRIDADNPRTVGRAIPSGRPAELPPSRWPPIRCPPMRCGAASSWLAPTTTVMHAMIRLRGVVVILLIPIIWEACGRKSPDDGLNRPSSSAVRPPSG